MKCDLAYQLLSGSVAAGLYTYTHFGELPPDAEATANFIRHVDCLGDSFNGHGCSRS